MRSILVKIVALLFVFNVALWIFYIVSDDYVEREVKNRTGRLIVNSLLYAKIAKPTFENKTLGSFERSVEIQELLIDKRLLGNERLRIYRYDNKEHLKDYFLFYDGTAPLKYAPVKVEPLTSSDAEMPRKDDGLQLMSRLFQFYKPMIDNRILTEPIVTQRARFNLQKEVLDSEVGAYAIRVLNPIRLGTETVGLVEAWDTYYIKDAYVSRNSLRLSLLSGMSILTIIFGIILAISIALPLRKLSRKLNQKLTPDDIAVQLENFSITSLSKRKDEIGSLHQNLVKLTKQVSDLFREKEQFAADVSHELKNPIASIIAYTENYEDGLPGQNTQTVGKIKQQAVRMNKLVSEISESAIVDHDLVTKKRERFDLSELISEIGNHYKDANDYSQLKITYQVPRRLMVVGLPDRVGQVVVNLIENAISFARPVGTVHISATKKWRKGIIISVEDSGTGVRDELKDVIFDRFFTSRRGNSEVENSSGLGLYICKQIVEAHGGTIQVTDRETGGCNFTITL